MNEKQAKSVIDSVIKELSGERKNQGISHEKLAEMCGLHRTSIGLIEARKREPTLLTLLKISDALNFDLGKIISKSMSRNR